MKGSAKVLCKLLLLSAAIASAQDYEEEDVGLYDEDVGWERSRPEPPGLSDDYNVEEHRRSRREVNEEWREENSRPRRSCCREEYEEYEPPRRSRRALHQYEVHEETGDEPQWTAPLYGPSDEMLAAASAQHNYHVRSPDQAPAAAAAEHYHRVPSEPGSPAPARYLAPGGVGQLAAAAEDQDLQGTFHHHKHHGGGQKHAAGGGRAHNHGHYAEHDGATTRGHKSVEHSDKGAKGSTSKHLHVNQHEEAEGERKKHHDDAGHSGHHDEAAHGHKGAKFDEKKGHKKGHKTKGYHNKYHKDEFHKEHKFYDDYHKGGSHHRYGKFHAKHASDEGGRKKAHHVDAAHDAVHKGTKGFSQKGHMDSDHRGHKSNQGHEAHHAHQNAYGKNGGNNGGSQYGYQKKN